MQSPMKPSNNFKSSIQSLTNTLDPVKGRLSGLGVKGDYLEHSVIRKIRQYK
jgi:hypothetical protein